MAAGRKYPWGLALGNHHFKTQTKARKQDVINPLRELVVENEQHCDYLTLKIALLSYTILYYRFILDFVLF